MIAPEALQAMIARANSRKPLKSTLLTPDGYSPKTDKGHARDVATAILYIGQTRYGPAKHGQVRPGQTRYVRVRCRHLRMRDCLKHGPGRVGPERSHTEVNRVPMNTQISDMCDGAGPHTGREVKRYPISGGYAIFCMHCWAEENKARFNEGKGAPQIDWGTTETYLSDRP